MVSESEIKYINALKVKKYRNKYLQFIAEGDKIIKELIAEGLEVVNIYTINQENAFPAEITKIVTDKQLDKMTALQHHHQSLAVFKNPATSIHVDSQDWVVLLDDIQDPGNMGTIIRTCDWFGVKYIVCSDGCVDAYNPKVVQASMASIGRIKVVESDLHTVIEQYARPVYGAVLNGKDYHEQSYTEKGFILIGNEGHGIHSSLMNKITYPVTIPRKGKAESLNAAIATALILDKL